MPDARQATHSQQTSKDPKIHSAQNPDDQPMKGDQSSQQMDNTSKSLEKDRISEPLSTTPDDQNISREKEASQLDTKHDNLSTQNVNRETCPQSDPTDTSENQGVAISQEVANTQQNLPIDGADISQSDFPLDSVDNKTTTPKETVNQPMLARDLGELKVSTKDSGKDVADKPSPINSEASSGNKGMLSILFLNIF